MDQDETEGQFSNATENAISNQPLRIDLYAILGVEGTATDKEILSAYEGLAVKYQTADSPDDIETCRKINQAFFVLSNESRRRIYDETGEVVLPTRNDNQVEEPLGTMDVSNLSGIGRVFGAMISRLGVPILTQISQEVLDVAQQICRNGGLQGVIQPSDPRLTDFHWGWGVESKVDRQAGAFFRLIIDDKHVENGFILHCRSPSKGKFKLIIFDADGNMIFQEACMKSRDGNVTQASLYFTNFPTFRLGEPLPNHLRENDTPILFSKLDHFIPNNHSVVPGHYLVCVYGDNFLGKTNFALLALHAKNDCTEVADIQEIEDKLRASKEALATFHTDFIKARDTYERMVRRLDEEGRVLEELLDKREESYRGFLNASAKSISDESPPVVVPTPAKVAPPVPVPRERDPITEASAAAAAAGGWIARGFASGFGQFTKIVTNVSTKVPTHSTDSAEAEAEQSEPVLGRAEAATTTSAAADAVTDVPGVSADAEDAEKMPLKGESAEDVPLVDNKTDVDDSDVVNV